MKRALAEFVQRRWYQPQATLFSRLLLPLSWLFCRLAAARRRRLQAAAVRLPVPVVIVGNIAVGGTGKTPLLCALAGLLASEGLRVGVISRGYGGHFDGTPRRVRPTDDPAEVGDEPLLLARRLRSSHCPVVIGHDRVAAARWLCEHEPVDVVLSDDGLQHYALARDIEIAVVDGARGLGNGRCLPAGPLREPPSRLSEVDHVVINGETSAQWPGNACPMQLEPLALLHVAAGLPRTALPAGTVLHAVAGIGNPARFFDMLRAQGWQVIEHPFPDHHAYRPADIAFADDLPVVMTEKDAVKCAAFAGEQVFFVPVAALLPDHFSSQFCEQVRALCAPVASS